jgi:hypothetical protein
LNPEVVLPVDLALQTEEELLFKRKQLMRSLPSTNNNRKLINLVEEVVLQQWEVEEVLLDFKDSQQDQTDKALQVVVEAIKMHSIWAEDDKLINFHTQFYSIFG